MGNIQCNSDKIKITFDMLEQFFKGNNSEFETRINFDYFSIKNLNNINNCNITNYIPIEKKKENFIKWIKLIGQSSFEEIKKSKNIEYQIESKLSKLYRDKNKKFIEYFLNGPPESIRPIIWIILSNKIPLERDDKYYKDLLNNKIEKNILEQIDKDINKINIILDKFDLKITRKKFDGFIIKVLLILKFSINNLDEFFE